MNMKTYFIFLDLPVHMEYSVIPMPHLAVGTIIEFDLVLRNPKDPRKIREIKGKYYLKNCKLTYISNEKLTSKRSGLVQYMEWEPCSNR
jgi:hypothetical protein